MPEMPPWSFEPKGRYDEQVFESAVLKIDAWRRVIQPTTMGRSDSRTIPPPVSNDAIDYRYPIAVKYLAERLTP